MREKLIELLYKSEEQADKRCDFAENCDKCPADNHPGIDCMDWLKADCLIANGVTVQKWIPVTERLPEKDGIYMCNVKSFSFPGKFYRKILPYVERGFIEGLIYTDAVTHWMPLPEPPKENE